MNFSKLLFVILASLVTGLLIYLNSPDNKYPFTEKSKLLNIKTLSPHNLAPLSVKLKDLTLQRGLFFTHQQGDHKLTGINESLGSGACVLDYDNDGWQDLFVVNGSGQNRFYGKRHWWQQQQTHQLFKNTGHDSFINITEDSGLAIPSWGMGCVATDFNNDGYSDLLITTLGANQLFKNNGNGTFSEIKNSVANSHSAWSTSACAADFDNDGLVDLYVANYIDFDKTKLNYEGQSEFTSNLTEFFNPTLFNPVSNRLYKNNGNFSFTDITQSSGLTDISSRSLAVRCIDINNDHLPDIIVGNEKGDGSNRLYINRGKLTFTDLSGQYQFQNNTGSRSIAIGDIDNDGREELFLMTGAQQNNRLYQSRFSEQNMTVYNDIARTWGLADNISSFQSNWGGGLHDFNQDGLLDFFVVNGFLTPDPDTPRVAKGQPNQLWLNTGKQFQPLNNLSPDLSSAIPESSRSSVFADFDNDGDMDIYITNNNHLGQLLINDSSSDAHWLGLQLVDNTNNKNLIGAKVSITGDTGMQTRTLSAGDSFLSDSEDRLLFGLGSDNHIKQIIITWPDGSIDHFDDIVVDQYVKIDITHGIIPYNITPKIQKEKLSLPSGDAKISVLFLSLMTQLRGIENALPYLHIALASPDVKIRKSAIKELAKASPPSNFALLIKSIDDKDDEVATFAVEKLCSFEDESTIRWLISALSDSRDIIRETAAHCFELLYHEEEAMIHRKYLALPALINLLSDTNYKVQIASARALAEAERFRAVAPLIALLDSEKPSIRSEAARALGLIREKDAINPLLSRLQNTNEVAEVFAHCLIALKRLGYENFSTTFDSFFQGNTPFNNIGTDTRVDTLLYLNGNTIDSIVINPQSLQNNATLLISHNITEGELLIKLIPVITSSSPGQLRLLKTLTKNPNPDIRFKSFIALLTHYPASRLNTLKQVAQDPSPSLINQLLNELADKQFNIPAVSLFPFLEKQSSASATIQVLATINNRDSARILSKELATSPYQAMILKSLENNPFALQEVAEPYLLSADTIIKQAALSFYLHKFPQNKLLKKMPDIFITTLAQDNKQIRNTALYVISERKELWALKSLEQVILDTSEKKSLRLVLISSYKHPFQKNWVIMLKIAKNSNDPIRYPVIELLSHFDEPKVINFFKALASNSETKEEIKIFALNTLSNKHPEWTLNALINAPRHH